MFDLIKKTMLAGVGFAAMTKDKVEQVIKEYIEKGEITEKEGKDLLNEFMQKSEHARKDMETRLEEMIQGVLKRMKIATQDDIKAIDERIKVLEQKPPSADH